MKYSNEFMTIILLIDTVHGIYKRRTNLNKQKGYAKLMILYMWLLHITLLIRLPRRYQVYDRLTIVAKVTQDEHSK